MRADPVPGSSPPCAARFATGWSWLLLAACGMPAAAMQPLPQNVPPALGQEQIVILYPGDETTVFDDDGAVDVQIALSPDLSLGRGDRLELLLDGRRIVQRHGKGFVLTALGDGRHHLQARIVSARRRAVIESIPVRFELWQAPGPAR